MFSLQSHNQVLYHLTQFASTVSTKSTPLPVKTKKENNHVHEKQSHPIDKKLSQTNIGSNIFLDNIAMNKLATPFCMKTNNAQLILEELCIKANKRHRWNVSYILKSGVAQKQSFPCAPLTEPIIVPVLRLSIKQQHRTLCTFSVKNATGSINQTRGFKTERSIRADKKSETFTSWFRRVVGEHIFLNKNTKTIEVDVEKVRNLLSDSTDSVETNKKLRAVFMEGFEMGLGHKKRSSPSFAGYIVILTLMLSLYLFYHLASWDAMPFSAPREYMSEVVEVKFDECKGVDTAKNELKEIVAYLRNPEKYVALGGKLPKGVLLVGLPGTGKTLLARAVAGEAGVPFFYASGSEFDDIFVGQGARRIKNLFRAAKERAPAVIFIDEIDSVGRKRTSSGTQPYANQTINQLLAEMDGFVRNEGVIVLGATNRRKMLDSALMRKGRFDVEIYIEKPDYAGRKEIIIHYLSKILSRDIEVDTLARKTIGFTGSEIESMINQGALRAASQNADYVTMDHLEYARDKVIMGPEKNITTDEETTRNSAYHEAGHALVAYYTKEAPPINKITIVPRGEALGHVSYIPVKEAVPQTKAELLARIDIAMGGRIAEELTFGPNSITTGAYSDLQKATAIAEGMVKNFGMSEKVGFRVSPNNDQPPMASSTNEVIDSEIKRLLNESGERARHILKTHSKELALIAESLLKYETLTNDDLQSLLTNKTIKEEELRSLVSDKANRPESAKIIPPLVDPTPHVL